MFENELHEVTFPALPPVPSGARLVHERPGLVAAIAQQRAAEDRVRDALLKVDALEAAVAQLHERRAGVLARHAAGDESAARDDAQLRRDIAETRDSLTTHRDAIPAALVPAMQAAAREVVAAGEAAGREVGAAFEQRIGAVRHYRDRLVAELRAVDGHLAQLDGELRQAIGTGFGVGGETRVAGTLREIREALAHSRPGTCASPALWTDLAELEDIVANYPQRGELRFTVDLGSHEWTPAANGETARVMGRGIGPAPAIAAWVQAKRVRKVARSVPAAMAPVPATAGA